MKSCTPAGDDDLGLDHRSLARIQAALDDLGEVVHGVQEDVVQFADFGFDVARHGQVDHEHRAVPARLERALDHAQADDRQRAGGAGDDDVVLRQLLGQFVQADGMAVEALGQRLGRAPPCGWRW